ncbi:MAG: tRNA dihydrouridine synthase DusB [Candidatus Omnitrophica bacterium]|nr:tRNA dihydrouridine synthase DusB [Candidatus Omnitrophota bacterium]
MLRIGSFKLNSNLILAPMAGVSDFPFRMLNRKFGCELAFVEMINCRSISAKSKRTQQMLFSNPDDRPLGVQLLGCEENFVRKALDVIGKYKFDVLDFNAACPVPKVVRRGEGAALLKDPKKLSGILKIIVKKSPVPVTVKIRTGWDKNSVNAVETALSCQDAGISGLFIHGRTRAQGYGGQVDYSSIARVKKSARIPVIASGDIFSPGLGKKMFDETGCDGIVIARGALGNPWIFNEISGFLMTAKTRERPALDELIKVMLGHLDMYTGYYGEKNGVIIFRKFFAWYTKGLRRVRPLRELVSRTKTYSDMTAIIRSLGAVSSRSYKMLTCDTI